MYKRQTWKGAPLTLSATTADDGTYSIVGPAGTWPTDYSLDGYVPLLSVTQNDPNAN